MRRKTRAAGSRPGRLSSPSFYTRLVLSGLRRQLDAVVRFDFDFYIQPLTETPLFFKTFYVLTERSFFLMMNRNHSGGYNTFQISG